MMALTSPLLPILFLFLSLLSSLTPTVMADSDCGKQIFFGREADSGRVTSPHYPKPYGDVLNCTYVIEERANWLIHLEVKTFETYLRIHTLEIYSRTVVEDGDRKGEFKADMKMLSR
jgi:hypothetical protein